MALEKKDVRAKLDPAWHGALAFEAEADGMDIGEWIEHLILRELKQRGDDSIRRAAVWERLGISGKSRER